MTILTKTARTILRSRIRRHKDAVLIGQFINGEYGATNVAALTKDQLLAVAAKFGVTVPSSNAIAAYEAAALQLPGADCLVAADAAEAGNLANIAPVSARQSPTVAAVVGTDADDADADADKDDDDADDAQPDTQPQPQPQPEAKSDDDAAALEKAIDADVKGILALVGSGDFNGYQERLKELAREARKPARVVTVAAVDTSKIAGHVPVKRGEKTMADVGIPALPGVKLDATRLAVYDSPDAPKADPNYQWHPQTALMLSVFRRGQPVFGYGPAGTGKTEFAKQVAARFGRRFVRISCDDQTEAQTLVGMTVPDKDGGVKWQDGQLTAAIRVPGCVILIDEPSVARPGALFVLQAVMDADKKIHVAETGEVVHVAPDVMIMLADNTNGTGDTTGQYEATRRLNRATLDRPDIVVRFDYLSPADEARVLVAKTGVARKAAGALAKFGALTRARADEGKLSHPVGLRRLLALAALLADGADPVSSFQLAVIEGAPYDDKEPLRQFFTADMDVKALAA